MASVNWAMASSTLPSCISSLPRLQASSAFGASCPNAGQTRSPHNSTATRQLGCRQRRGCTFIACSCSSSPILHDRRTLLGAACMPCPHPLRVASLEPDLHRHGTTNGHQRAPCVAWSVGRSVPRGEFLHPGERVPGHVTLHFGRARGTQRRDEPGLRFPGLGVTRKDGESSLHRVYSGRKASSLPW